jgi:hypothetical protein
MPVAGIPEQFEAELTRLRAENARLLKLRAARRSWDGKSRS